MWIEVQPRNAPKETLLFGPGGIIAISPGAFGSVLVFSNGTELVVEDAYSVIRDNLAPPVGPSQVSEQPGGAP